MTRFTQIFIGLVFIISGAASAFAQSSNGKIVEQIMQREAEYNESSKKPNAEDFSRFYTADFMVTARVPAKIQTKAENVARFKDPNIRHGTVESLTDDDVKVRVYGDDTAIATGSWKRVSKDADGKDTSAAGRFTRV